MADNTAERYIDLYRQLHAEDPHYGTTSIRWLPLIQHYVYDLNPDSILDYGCGKGVLIEQIKTDRDITRYRYDPAIPQFAGLPAAKVGMVLCIDVMEHIPEENVDDVLSTIRSLSDKALFNISCSAAWNTLPDGSNAHCTVHPREWWEERMKKLFDNVENIPSSSKDDAWFATWQVGSHFVPRFKTLKKIVRPILNLVCALIPVRKWRHAIRDSFSKM